MDQDQKQLDWAAALQIKCQGTNIRLFKKFFIFTFLLLKYILFIYF